MSKIERLRLARRVTRKPAMVFADTWEHLSRTSEVLTEAFAQTKLVEWPSGDGVSWDETDAQRRYSHIKEEIFERTFDAAREAIETAFVQAAMEVLARERKRQVGR